MGGGSSISKEDEVWSPEEKEANDKVLAEQHVSADFIARHAFYGVPVKCAKQSADPLSALLLEVDPALIEDEKKSKMGDDLFKVVPSMVSINSKGDIKIVFASSQLEYKLHNKDIVHISTFIENLEVPKAPLMLESTQTCIKFHWYSEFAGYKPGICFQAEMQYCKVDRRYKVKNNGSKLKWHTLTCKNWYSSEFYLHTLDELTPDSHYTLRLRVKNHLGWSPYSLPSLLCSTLSAEPAAPDPPSCEVLQSDYVELAWTAPPDNGSPIVEYILRGRSAGDDEFVTLYQGSLLNYTVMHLIPEFIYSFDLTARNEIGVSPPSSLKSVTTPARIRTKEHVDVRLESAYHCKAAWRELWDPKTEQIFYFNQLTGTRQLNVPLVLQEKDDEVSTERATKKLSLEERRMANLKLSDPEKYAEVMFRKKRYRINLAVHKHAAAHNKSLQSLPRSTAGPLSLAVLPPIDAEHSNAPRTPPSQHGGSLDSSPARAHAASMPVLPSPSRPGTSSGGKHDTFHLDLHRTTALADTFSKFNSLVGHHAVVDLRKRTKVSYAGEPGIDSGGLTKDFYMLMSKEIAVICGKRYYGWFRNLPCGSLYITELGCVKKNSNVKPANENSETPEQYVSLEKSIVELEKNNSPFHVSMFALFAGRFVGKAFFDRHLIDMPLGPLILQHMISPSMVNNVVLDGENNGESSNNKEGNQSKRVRQQLKQLEDIDPIALKSLLWMLDNDITDVIYETFSVAMEDGSKEVPLYKDGHLLDVTEDNKLKYIKLMCEWKTTYGIAYFLQPFLRGFHEIIPQDLLMKECVQPDELNLILCGKKSIDVEDIRAYCIYQGTTEGFGEDHEDKTEWLWRALREFNQEKRRLYLKFVTGTSRVPLDGYDPPFNVTEGVDMDEDALPRAHTCFNQIVIPPYSSYEACRDKIEFAITNSDGFMLS